MIPVIANPTFAINSEEYADEELDIQWKLLIVVSRINVCLQDKVISGFALIGYTDGEMLVFERVNIPFDGLPLFINNGLLSSFCFYKPATNL